MIRRALIPFVCLALTACGPEGGSVNVSDATENEARMGSDGDSLVDNAIEDEAALADEEPPIDASMPPIDAGDPSDVAQRWANALEARDWETA
ncbi:MAG TPA: hypothetical protein EYG02_07685, partial [Henriciella marina]|nr:hypothetical protein [Henriciella marina]